MCELGLRRSLWVLCELILVSDTRNAIPVLFSLFARHSTHLATPWARTFSVNLLDFHPWYSDSYSGLCLIQICIFQLNPLKNAVFLKNVYLLALFSQRFLEFNLSI